MATIAVGASDGQIAIFDLEWTLTQTPNETNVKPCTTISKDEDIHEGDVMRIELRRVVGI